MARIRTDLEELLPHTEWGVFLSRLPVRAYREAMTEEAARAWLDDWAASGGARESFVLASREVGAWQLIEDGVPRVVMPNVHPGYLLQLVKAQSAVAEMRGIPR